MSSNTSWSHVVRLSLLVLLCCLVGLQGVATAVGTTGAATASQANTTADQSSASTTPQLELELGGGGVTTDRTVVKTDPRLTINASVGSAVTKGTTIENVVVRINGQTFRSYNPDESPTEITAELPLDRGNNTVTVIVEDSAENVNSKKIEVTKDDLAPWIGLTSPYDSKLTSVIPNGTVDESLVTFGVRSGDLSGIDLATIDVNYTSTYTSDHTNQETEFSNVETIRVDDPGKRFLQDALLGYGNNTVSISLTDEVGNRRTETFNLEVVDDDAPTVSIDLYPEQTTDHRIELSGTISDNVWLRNASLEVVNLDKQEEIENVSSGYKLWNYTKSLKRPEAYDHERSGRSLEFTEAINLQKGTSRITFTATDHLGQTVTRSIEIERLDSVDDAEVQPPSVTIDRNKTRLRRDGLVHLVANVSDPDWDIDTVAIETANLSTGKIIDFEQFRSLGNRNSVTINTTLRGGDRNDSIVVRARARDRNGKEDIAVQQLKWRTDEPDEPDVDPVSTVTPTTTQSTATPTPTTPESTPTTTPTSTPTNTSMNESAANNSGGLFGGGIVDAVIGFVIAIIPFVVGGIVFVTVAYFVLRRVREEGGSESAS